MSERTTYWVSHCAIVLSLFIGQLFLASCILNVHIDDDIPWYRILAILVIIKITFIMPDKIYTPKSFNEYTDDNVNYYPFFILLVLYLTAELLS